MGRLSEQQQSAITMLANGATHADVARHLGVNRRTVGRWRKRPDFAQRLEDATREVEEFASHRMRTLGAVALNQLAKMATDPKMPAMARVRVCERLLEMSQLQPADRSKEIADMNEEDVIELVTSLGSAIVAEAARRLDVA